MDLSVSCCLYVDTNSLILLRPKLIFMKNSKKILSLLLFCLLPFLSACQSSSAQRQTETDCKEIRQAAKSVEHLPYKWGGESPGDDGLDCSGLIYHIQKKIGQPVPRTTAAKYYIAAEGDDKHWSNATCGDWIWWQFSPDRPYGHIGIHADQSHVWQSGSSTGPTKIQMQDGGYWDKQFKTSKKKLVNDLWGD